MIVVTPARAFPPASHVASRRHGSETKSHGGRERDRGAFRHTFHDARRRDARSLDARDARARAHFDRTLTESRALVRAGNDETRAKKRWKGRTGRRSSERR